MAESASFTSRSRNRLCNKAAQEAIITGRGENWAAFTRAHIYKWVNKRGRLWAHKAVKSTVLLSAVASLNEDRLITLEAQIKLFKRIMRRNSRSSRQSDCKIWLKILWFYTPFPLCSPGKAQCATLLHRAPIHRCCNWHPKENRAESALSSLCITTAALDAHLMLKTTFRKNQRENSK